MSETAKTRKPRTKKAPVEEQPAARFTAVAKTALNFRNGPGYEHTVIRELPKGQKLYLQGEMEDGFMAAALPDGSEGWVCLKWVEVIDLV